MNKIKCQRLTDIESGMSVVIESFEGGGAFKEKLISMGILPGKAIEILSSRKNGPVVLKVNDTRLALGHGMAYKIYVKNKN
ncbi:MAG TPA: FeoA family protein [Spirochaetota bacterium]|nr:FeoA family protein [Spirochaetota bacterium]HPJ34396.1 FeoA family protein [Spirochaetota bacterium]